MAKSPENWHNSTQFQCLKSISMLEMLEMFLDFSAMCTSVKWLSVHKICMCVKWDTGLKNKPRTLMHIISRIFEAHWKIFYLSIMLETFLDFSEMCTSVIWLSVHQICMCIKWDTDLKNKPKTLMHIISRTFEYFYTSICFKYSSNVPFNAHALSIDVQWIYLCNFSELSTEIHE